MPKKKKKPSPHYADKWFSLYVRIRDSDDDGNIHCCSCGKEVYWRDADAGHFIPRQHRATRYHESNVFAQCRKCNRFDNGNPAGYSLFLINKYGTKMLEDLDLASRGTTKWTPFEIKNMADNFKEKAISIATKKGLVL